MLTDSNVHGMLAIAIETGRFVYANPAICRMLGYSAQELLQLGMGDIHPKDVLPRVLSEFKAKMLGMSLARNLPCLRKDGTVFLADVSGVQMNIQGRKCAVGFFVDVTDRKRAEDRIKMVSRELMTVTEDVKKRISSLLHHDVGSLAVGLSASFDAMEKDMRSGKTREALKWMKQGRALLDQSVARLKNMAVDLRPPELDILGLSAALRQYFARVTGHGGVLVRFTETLGKRGISGEADTILFRIAQEALTNAIRHGHAKKVDVGLTALKNTLFLEIRDNGKGFDPTGARVRDASRLGLRVMQEMADSIEGTFKIDSNRGKGTQVSVSLPLKKRE